MPTPKLWSYEVRGEGWFPLDMLRYDHAWVSLTINHRAFFCTHHPNPIATMIQSHKKPTIDRWNSFGWSVQNITESKHL